jgi:hypothetical protein
MIQLSEPDALALMNDRVKFKLYAAEQELDSLRQLEKCGLNISSSAISRIIWEMKIESFLAQLVGCVDALLVRVNDKLRLGLNIWEVNSGARNLTAINNKLIGNGKGILLLPLTTAIAPKDWLWTLKDLRNRGMHRQIINVKSAVSLHEDLNTGKSCSDKNRVYLITNPQTNLEIIPYLEDSYEKTKNLVESIINTEPSLKV